MTSRSRSPGPAARVILRGKGRWLGLREPLGSAVLLSEVTGPVVLAEPPPPPQPLSIAALPAGLTTPTHERAAAAQRARLRRHLAAGTRPRRERVADRPRGGAAARVDAIRARARGARRGVRARVRQGRTGVRRPRRRQAADPLAPGADLMLVFPEDPPPPIGPTQDFTTRDHFLRDPEIAVAAARHPAPLPRPRARRDRPGERVGDERADAAREALPAAAAGRAAERRRRRAGGGRPRPRARPRRARPDARRPGAARRRTAARPRSSSPGRGPTSSASSTRGRASSASTRARAASGPCAGAVTGVTDLGGGHFTVDLALARPVAADAARGSYLPAGGEYRILGHGAGTTIQATVETLVPPRTAPSRPRGLGATVLPVPLDRRRTTGRTPGTSGSRSCRSPPPRSTSSSCSTCSCPTPTRRARSSGSASAPPTPSRTCADSFPGGTRPRQREPARRRALRGALPRPAGARRAAADRRRARRDDGARDPGRRRARPRPAAVPRRHRARRRRARRRRAALRTATCSPPCGPTGATLSRVPPPSAPREADETPIPVPNPGDRAAITAALTDDPLGLADRYVVWLAASHPFADWLFTRARAGRARSRPAGARSRSRRARARYVVRVRRVDAAGHRSAGAATCAMVLRVPALAPLAPPELAGARWTATPDGPRVELTASRAGRAHDTPAHLDRRDRSARRGAGDGRQPARPGRVRRPAAHGRRREPDAVGRDLEPDARAPSRRSRTPARARTSSGSPRSTGRRAVAARRRVPTPTEDGLTWRAFVPPIEGSLATVTVEPPTRALLDDSGHRAVLLSS